MQSTQRLGAGATISIGAAAVLLVLLLILHTSPVKRHDDHGDFCDTGEYRKNVLKLVKEAPFAGLFADLKNHTKFEASGVAFDPRTSTFLSVFDSSMSVGRIDETLQFRGPSNVLIGEQGPESQFEGISLFDEGKNQWLLLAESIPKDGTYYPEVTLAALTEGRSDSYEVLERCVIDFPLSHENKGFESIIYLPETGTLLGLCEGNHCVGGRKGRERGHGRIVVSKRATRADGECTWEVIDTIAVPSLAAFQDYSAMAYHRDMKKLAILSQEDAAVALLDFDLDTLRFADDAEAGGVVWHLPRDANCDVVYCNAEGIAWLDEYRVLIVSDKAKSKQDVACVRHDQSAAIFVVPSGFDPYDPYPL